MSSASAPVRLRSSGGALHSLKGTTLPESNPCPLTPPPGYTGEHDNQLTIDGTNVSLITLVEIGEGDTNG